MDITENLKSIDEAKNYNIYYKNGDESLYNKRFGKNRITKNERYLFLKTFNKSLQNFLAEKRNKHSNENGKTKEVSEFTILDFGCGDGRMLPLFEEVANILLKKNIKLKVIGYDISSEGLTLFKDKLVELGYIIDEKDNCLITNKNKSIKIHLKLGNVESTKQSIVETISQKVDMVVCMFGVLANVKTETKRLEILSSLKELLNKGAYILNIAPAYGSFIKEIKCYSYLKSLGHLDALDLRDGDFYYAKQSSSGETLFLSYCHSYKYDEFLQNHRVAGFNNNLSSTESGISSIVFPVRLTNNKVLNNLDFYGSLLLSKFPFIKRYSHRFVSYFYVICRND